MIKGLFCGISKYRCSSEELSFCKNDAIEMKNVFTHNFVVAESDIHVIGIDGAIEKTEYLRELKTFNQSCQEDDLAIVYFSGHGGVDDQGDNYLVLSDTFNEDTGIYFDVLIDRLNESKAKRKVVILDCCHADSSYGTKSGFNIERAVDELYQSGITALFSCKNEESSYPYEGNNISAFTQFICDAIQCKSIYRPEGIFFNDLKLLVELYAKVWNKKYPDKKQTPMFRSNMIGTIVFPLRYPPVLLEKPIYSVTTNRFDILKLSWDVKSPLGKEEKIYSAIVRADVDIEAEEFAFIKEVVGFLLKIRLPAQNIKQKRTSRQAIDSIHLWIGKDILDMEERNYKYLARWDKSNEQYWCKNLGKQRIQYGKYAYKVNTDYERVRKNRIQYTLPDKTIWEFWNENIAVLVKQTELAINKFGQFNNHEITYQEAIEFAIKIREGLYNSYKDAFESWFPIPGSILTEFCKLSYELATEVQGLLFAIDKEKKEDYTLSNFEINQKRYYEILNKWINVKNALE